MLKDKSNQTRVTICGGGNGSHASASVISSQPNFSVNIITRKPKSWSKSIIGITKGSNWESRGDFKGNLNIITDDPSDVCNQTDIWIISGPAQIHQTLLKQIQPYVRPGQIVGTIFAQGGFLWMCQQIFGKNFQNVTFFGFFTIPFICKIKEYGHSVNIVGPKTELWAAVEPKSKQKEIQMLVETMWTIKCLPLPNFLTLTLTPSNQIIHPGRIYGVFKDWDGQTPYKESQIPLFYEDMDDYSAYELNLLDIDVQNIKNAINKIYPQVDLRHVLPLKDRIIRQYGNQVKDKSSLKSVFRTNQGYTTIKIPVKQVKGGFIPNTDARIFWEDIPYGLCILKQIASFLNLESPAIDKMIRWHQQFMGKVYLMDDGKLNQELIHETGVPSNYGIDSLEKLVKYQFDDNNSQMKIQAKL